MYNAAEGGHLAVLRWARQHDCPWNEGTCSGAAGGGQLAILRWAREHNCRWGEQTLVPLHTGTWSCGGRGRMDVRGTQDFVRGSQMCRDT